jgi:UDP-N-acetylglucosamine--N-acetylmuramyl-(pentapeptide) pyrophosphoryl-undecaprenol N-acetylglucosamine transferase
MKAAGILFCGGGTGGHIYPGLAVAQALKDRGITAQRWVGDPSRLEATLVPKHGIPLLPWGLSRPRPKSPAWWLSFLKGFLLVGCEFLRHPPKAVVATGGYASIVPGLWAAVLRRPLYVLESNALPGKVNRLLSCLATCSIGQFAAGRELLHGSYLVLGNPVRRFAQRPRGQNQTVNILVMGGSLSASGINRLALAAAPLIAKDAPLHFVHLAGTKDQVACEEAWKNTGLNVEVVGYEHDMPRRYLDADLAISRSGATTVAELCAAGIGAIFIPYPHAADDHQSLNAQAIATAGGALVLKEADGSGQILAEMIATLVADRSKIAAMGENARHLSRPGAAKAIAKLITNSYLNRSTVLRSMKHTEDTESAEDHRG